MLKEWILWILTTHVLFSSPIEWQISPTQAQQGCPDQPCRCGDYCFRGTITTCSGCNPACLGKCCTGPGTDECFVCSSEYLIVSGQCNIPTTNATAATTTTTTATVQYVKSTTAETTAKTTSDETTPDPTQKVIATTTIQTKTSTGSTVTTKIFQALSTLSNGSANQNTIVTDTSPNTLAPGSSSTVSNQSTTNSTSGSSVDSNNNGLAIGLGVSTGLAGISSIAIAIFKFVWKKHKKRCCGKSTQDKKSKTSKSESRWLPPLAGTHNRQMRRCDCQNLPPHVENDETQNKDFNTFEKEFNKILSTSSGVAQEHSHSKCKVVPLDHSYSHFWVEIPVTQSKCSSVKHHYITTQSPVDISNSKTWSYIFLNSIKTVMFLGKSKRFPRDRKIGEFHLEVKKSEFADFTVWVIQAESRESKRTVHMYEFTAWPDKGVPDDPIPFLDVLWKIRQYQGNQSSPILVQSETDDGRVGVYVAVDSLIQLHTIIGLENGINVYSFVDSMSTGPQFMIRTFKQYAFIYDSIFEEFHAGETRLNAAKLKSKGKNNPPKLCRCFDLGTPEPNLKHNMFVDGYRTKKQFILTKTPQRKKIADFWRLVVDNNVQAIVMIGNNKHNNDYWSDGSVEIEKTQFCLDNNNITIPQHDFIIRKLKLPGKVPKRNQPDIVQFHFSKIAVSQEVAMDLVIFVLSYQKLRELRTIMVHCKDGFTHSGLFVALWLLCEKMMEDEVVDAYHTIKHLVRQNPQFIKTDRQFQYCYKCLPGLRKRVKKMHQS